MDVFIYPHWESDHVGKGAQAALWLVMAQYHGEQFHERLNSNSYSYLGKMTNINNRFDTKWLVIKSFLNRTNVFERTCRCGKNIFSALSTITFATRFLSHFCHIYIYIICLYIANGIYQRQIAVRLSITCAVLMECGRHKYLLGKRYAQYYLT